MPALKSKKHWLLVVFYFGALVLTFAQDKVVPDAPDEVEVLSSSFKDGYTGAAFDYVETTSFLERLSNWFRDVISSLFNVQSQSASQIINVLKKIFWFAVILGVIYLIVKIILKKEIRWIFKRNKEKKQNLNFEIGENISEVDFNALISEAATNKDYRSAIRYYYLFLLKKLDQFNVIEYDPQKTSFDYQNEVQESKYNSDFSKATYYYTYIWYGEFAIDENEYKQTSSVFDELLKQVKG